MARNVKKVLYWQEIASESIHEYELCLNQLDAMEYTFTAFVIDGRTGVRQFLMKRYPGKPIQLCQFHQIETVKRYIPMRAKTEAGKRLRQTLGLAKTYAAEFEQDLNNWYAKEKIINFKIDLNEKMNDFGRKGNNWLEPFKEWILSAHQAVRYANTENLEEKRMFLQKIAIS